MGHASAAIVTWYGTIGATPVAGGSGTWNASSANWTTNGTTFTSWPGTGNTALFNATAGTVSLASTTELASGLTFSSAGYTLTTGTINLSSGSVITTTSGTTTLNAVAIAGPAGDAITKTGVGTLAINTADANLGTAASPAVWTVSGGTYSGGIFNSVLSIGAGNNLGVTPTAASTQVILNAGTLQVTGTALAPAIGSARTIQVNALGGAIVDSSGNPYQGAIVDNAGSTTSLYLSNSNASGTTNISGVISSTGGITWNGTGTLSLTAATNTYTGGTTINSGAVQFTADSNLSTGPVNLNGGTLITAQTAGVTFLNTLATGTTGGTIQLNNGAASSSTSKLLLGTANQITGSGNITVTDNGCLSIDAANTTYTGNWTLNGGVTELVGSTAGGSGSITVNSGAELSTLGSQISNALTLNGGTLSWDYYSGSGIYKGNVALTSANTVALSNFYGSGSMSGTISGNITGTGSLAVTPTNSVTSYGGVLTLSGTGNTYNGGTSVALGTTLQLSSGSSVGTGALSVAGTVNLGGNNISVASLSSQSGDLDFSLAANGTPNKITVGTSSDSLTGTTGIQINTSGVTSFTPGTYTLISSTNGGLTGAVSFAGGQALTVAATTSIQNINGTNYRLTLNDTSTGVTVTAAVATTKVINIMPLGSSITAGQSAQDPYNGGGYRSQLYQSLVDDGRFTPEFVGSNVNTLANDPTQTDLMTAVGQTHHEGHPGYTTTQTLNNINGNDSSGGNDGGYWLAPGNGVNPDYITLNIGGNDFVANTSDTAAITRLGSILTQISTLRPNADILVSNIMYRGDGSGAYAGINSTTTGFLNLYNPLIPALVYNDILAGLHVQFVDLYDAITPNNSLANIGPDLVHPTQAGYDSVANVWYSALATGQAFYTGKLNSTWSSTSSGSTNWDMDYARTTDSGVVPGSGTDVYFNGGGGGGTTTLGQNIAVHSVNFAAGATTPVTIAGGGNTLSIGAGGITVQAGTAAHVISAPVALTANQEWANVSTNPFTASGAISGSSQVTIGGTGLIRFFGSNTFSGGTNVTSGTLEIDNTAGSGTGTGAVSLLSGATLTGSGSISGSVDAKSGATVAPGTTSGIATLIMGALDLESGSKLNITLSTPSAAGFVETTGSTVNYAGATLSLALASNFVPVAGSTYMILDDIGTATTGDRFAGLPNSGSTIQDSGTTFTINYAGGDGNDVTVSVVPEPTGLGFVACAASLGLVRRRARAKTAK